MVFWVLLVRLLGATSAFVEVAAPVIHWHGYLQPTRLAALFASGSQVQSFAVVSQMGQACCDDAGSIPAFLHWQPNLAVLCASPLQQN